MGEVGGKLLQRERESESEREREKERERGAWWVKGACIFLRRIASDQYSLLLQLNYLRALNKTMQYLSDISKHNH